jgi:hypothetical protein
MQEQRQLGRPWQFILKGLSINLFQILVATLPHYTKRNIQEIEPSKMIYSSPQSGEEHAGIKTMNSSPSSVIPRCKQS